MTPPQQVPMQNNQINQQIGQTPQQQNMNQNNMMGPPTNRMQEDPFAKSMGGNQPMRQPTPPMIGGMNTDLNGSRSSSTSLGMMDSSSQKAPQNAMMNSASNQSSNNQAKMMMESTIKQQEQMIQSRKEDISTMNSQFNSGNQLLASLKEKSERLRRELDKLNIDYKSIQSNVYRQNEEIKQEINNISDMTGQLTNMMGGRGTMPNAPSTPQKRDLNMGNIKVMKPNNGMGGFGGPPQMNNGMMSDRQPRMMNNGPNDYATAMPNNMNRQMRPQSSDPSRGGMMSHNFGVMNNQQRPNDDFNNNSAHKGPSPSMNSGGDDIDWGM